MVCAAWLSVPPLDVLPPDAPDEPPELPELEQALSARVAATPSIRPKDARRVLRLLDFRANCMLAPLVACPDRSGLDGDLVPHHRGHSRLLVIMISERYDLRLLRLAQDSD